MKLSTLLSSLDHGSNTIIDSKSGNYNHDDAIISFVLQAAIDCYKVFRILSIDIFVLVDWMFKAKNSDSNEKLGRESGFDQCNVQSLTKSLSNVWACIFDRLRCYLFLSLKGKVSALTDLTEGNFIYFGEINASESDLMKVERDYTSAWYGQTKGISLPEAR